MALAGNDTSHYQSIEKNLWIYQNRQKCEIYARMQWMFGIQAILGTCETKY